MGSAIAPTLSNVDYHPTGGNAYQRLDFYRVGEVSGVTYPVLVVFPDTPDGTFGQAPVRPSTLSPGEFAYFARCTGFSVAYCSYTVTDDSLAGDGLFGGAEYAEQDAQRVVQYLRQNASSLGIDSTRIFGYGRGAGATAMAFAAFGPDGADVGSANPEEQQSTRMAGAALVDFVANWDSVLDTVAAEHFSITPSDTLGDIASGTLDSASLLSYGFPSINAAVPYFLAGRGTAVSSDYVSPYPTNSESLTSAWHALAAGAVLAAETPAFHDGVDSRTIVKDGSSGVPSLASIEVAALDFLLFEAGMLSAAEVVLLALERRLAEITLANGYTTDVKRVYRYGDPDGSGGIFPSIMIYTAGDRYDEGPVAGRDSVSLSLGLDLKLEGAQAHNRRSSSFLADVRKRLKQDIQFGNLIDTVEVKRAQRVLDQSEGGERCGATCELELEYLERVFDPFVNAPDTDGAGPYNS